MLIKLILKIDLIK